MRCNASHDWRARLSHRRAVQHAYIFCDCNWDDRSICMLVLTRMRIIHCSAPVRQCTNASVSVYAHKIHSQVRTGDKWLQAIYILLGGACGRSPIWSASRHMSSSIRWWRTHGHARSSSNSEKRRRSSSRAAYKHNIFICKTPPIALRALDVPRTPDIHYMDTAINLNTHTHTHISWRYRRRMLRNVRAQIFLSSQSPLVLVNGKCK